MVIPSGLSAQFGMVAESTYGTGVSPSRFLEFESESIKRKVGAVDGFVVGRGVYQRSARRRHYTEGAAGDVTFPMMTKGMGLLLKHAIGGHSAAQQGATSEYLHTITPDANGKAGLFATVQVGRPDVTTPTIQPFTYEGGKIVAWELSAALGQRVMFRTTWDFETEVTATALASASYSTADDFMIFADGSVSLGGSTVYVKSFKIAGVQPMATDRRFIGNTKKEPIANGEFVITADLEFEFEGLTRHAAWVAGTELSNLIITLDTGEAVPAGDGGNFGLVATLPLVIPVDAGPNVGGPDVLGETIQYKALNNGSDPVITLAYTTTDTAA